MKNNEVWICSCSRVHFVANKLWSWLKDNPDSHRLYRVCQSCGNVSGVMLDNFDTDCFMVNTISEEQKNFDLKSTSPSIRVWLSTGCAIPLTAGVDANVYQSGKFANIQLMEVEGEIIKSMECTDIDWDTLATRIKNPEDLQDLKQRIVGAASD